MNHLPKGLPAGLATFILLAGALFLAVTPGGAAAEGDVPIKFGMTSAAASAQTAAGVKPDYGTFWIGPWTLSSGWAGPDGQMTNLKNAGITPAIHFYYWGDDISPTCVENGCWSSLHNAQKTRAGWEELGSQLTDHLNAKMGGAPVLIFLESEFNKGGIETYEPFDGYMAAMADKIHAGYPNAIVVLGFGNWGSAHWGTFDRAAAASDMVGIQGMRGSTRQSLEQMYTLYDSLLAGVKTLGAKFPGKPVMLTDIAVSSYPEPDYVAVQAEVIQEIFDNLATLKAHGVRAMIYRSWQDTPTMDLANYYGMAERYWGLTNANGFKPSAHVWIEGVQAERAGSTATFTTTSTSSTSTSTTSAAVPVGSGVTMQVEDFATKQAGGKQSDAQAQGGAMWNLWSNGAVAQTYDLHGAYDLTVRARGTPANGIAAHMDVYVAGVKVLAADPGAAYADYRVAVSGSGPTEVRIAFTNDAKTATEDRNLILDAVSLVPVNRAPTAAFTATASGLAVSFDATASSDPDGDALTYAWSFGDGATGTGRVASHTYAAEGTYTVTLMLSDGKATASASSSVRADKPYAASFKTHVNSNEWWVQAKVASSPAPAQVHAQANGGSWHAMALQSYGDWTVSFHVPKGSQLVYRATASDGQTALSTPETWLTSTTTSTSSGTTSSSTTSTSSSPTPSTSSTSSPTSSPTSSTTPSTSSTTTSASATASTTSATTTSTSETSTSPSGTSSPTTSTTTTTTAATTTSTTTTTSAAPFTATFTPIQVGNDWWVEVGVSANEPIAKVEVKNKNGPWVLLALTQDGTYARSMLVPNGSQLTFLATSESGATSSSSRIKW